MAVFESVSTTTYGSRTNTTITAPTGIAAGELLVLGIQLGHGASSDDPPTPPSGFTAIPGSWPFEVDGPGLFVDYRMYSKVAGGSEPANYTVLHASRTTQAVMMRISDADPTTPFDVTPTQNEGIGDARTWTGLTTTTDGALIVALGFDWGDTSNNLSPPSGSTPTFTEQVDITVAYVASGVLAASGATGNKTQTCNASGSGAWGAILLAIRSTILYPANTVAPVVTGALAVGETLSCTTGTWTGTPTPTYTYQWQSDTGSGFADISGATSSTYVLDPADEGADIRGVVTATNTEGFGVASSNEVGPVAPPLPLSFSFRLSGGAGNTNLAASIGGAESSTDYTGTAGSGSLFDSSPFTEHNAGHIDYRCVYIHNEDAEDATVLAYISQQLDPDGQIAIAVADEPAGATVETIANDQTAPSGPSFSAPEDLGSAIDLGTIEPGEGRGLWIRRTIDAASTPAAYAWEISLEITPA